MPKPYSRLPIEVVRDKSISPLAKILFAEIIYRCNGKGFSYGKISGWADAIGCTTKHLRKLRSELISNHLITEEAVGKVITFTMVLDEPTGAPCDSLANLQVRADEPTGAPNPVLANPQVRPIERDNIKRDNKRKGEVFLLWGVYPRKDNQTGSFLAFKEMREAGKLPDIQVLVDAVTALTTSGDWKGKETRFIPYMANWLRDERWKDESIPKPQKLCPQCKSSYVKGRCVICGKLEE